MKKTILIIILLVCFGALFSWENYSLLSVADTDNFLAPKVNPAAMSFGNAKGLAFLGNYDENGIYEDRYSVFFNYANFAYVFDKTLDDEHTFAFSSKIIRNLYLGVSYYWKNSHYKDGDFNEAILYRPFDFMSFGATAMDLFTDEVTYRTGLAIRPVFFNNRFGDRITLTADFLYDDEQIDSGSEFKWQKPILGVQTEIFDGVCLGGNYDLENETFGINFGLSLSKFDFGSITGFDQDNEFSSGQHYLHISENIFRSIITKPFEKNKFYNFKLSGKIVEKKMGSKFGPFTILMTKDKTLREVIDKIELLKNDDNIKGIVFKSGNFSTSFANIIELKNALLDFKKTGKKIVFYYEEIGNINYAFAASVADEIYLNPAGYLDLRGIAVKAPYLGSLLDTLGIEIYNFRSHEYKSAANIFTESEMTDAERESYEFLLDGLYDEMVKMIETGREEKINKPVTELIDNGPYFIAQDAMDAGLIDGLIYEDELEDKIKDSYSDAKIIKRYCTDKIRYDWSDEKKDKVALIYAIGNFHMGKGKIGQSIGSKTMAEKIKKAREDKSIKGIILRIDSGGGSSLASAIITREIKLCLEGENKKPVVVSMGGVAASAGYEIACFTDKIIAQPTTITGSIGVIGMAANLKGLYDKLLINWSIVKKGKHSDIGTTARPLTEEEIKKIERAIEDSYQTFISEVAEGRGMDKEQVHEIAKGRVWTGEQALERGLIDGLGGLNKAIEEMKKIAELSNEIELVEIDSYKSKFTFSMNMGRKTNLQLPDEMQTMINLAEELQQYGDEKVLKLMHLKLEIK